MPAEYILSGVFVSTGNFIILESKYNESKTSYKHTAKILRIKYTTKTFNQYIKKSN